MTRRMVDAGRTRSGPFHLRIESGPTGPLYYVRAATGGVNWYRATEAGKSSRTGRFGAAFEVRQTESGFQARPRDGQVWQVARVLSAEERGPDSKTFQWRLRQDRKAFGLAGPPRLTKAVGAPGDIVSEIEHMLAHGADPGMIRELWDNRWGHRDPKVAPPKRPRERKVKVRLPKPAKRPRAKVPKEKPKKRRPLPPIESILASIPG